MIIPAKLICIYVSYLLGPVYSGKQKFKGRNLSFSAKRSFLLRNKIMFVSTKQGWSHIWPNKLMDSFIRLVVPSSTRTWIRNPEKVFVQKWANEKREVYLPDHILLMMPRKLRLERNQSTSTTFFFLISDHRHQSCWWPYPISRLI